ELWLRARHAGAHHGRRVAVAGTLPWPVAFFAQRRSVCERRGLARPLGASRERSTRVRKRPLCGRSRTEIRLSRYEGESALQFSVANATASGEPRHLPSRTGDHAAAAAWRQTHRYRHDRLLPRTRRTGRSLGRSRHCRVEAIHTVEWMKQLARQARADGRLTGLVPTMGALHVGHLSLIEAAKRDASPVVVSIFVNPKQFGPGEDYKKYPRDMEGDRQRLEEAGVDYLFAPSVAEIYPAGFRTAVNVEGLADRLEGKVRPGHFRGVATVVLKLLEIVA